MDPDLSSVTTPFKSSGNLLWFILTSLAAALLCVLNYVKLRISKGAKMANSIPGAPPLPFIGNVMHLMMKENLKEAISDYLKTYGRVCRIWKFGQPVVFIADGKAAGNLLQTADMNEKGSDNVVIRGFLGNGLVAADGMKAKHDRKVLNPGFNRQLFDGFLEVFNKEGRKLVDILDNKFKDIHSPTNIHPEILKCSLEIVFQTSLGKEMHIQNERDGEKGFIQAFATGLKGIHYRLFKPWMTLPIVVDVLGITKSETECKQFIRDALLGALRDRREARNVVQSEDEEEKTKPFIDVLLDSGVAISDQDICDHLITIVGAGSDTISTGINYTLFLMATHPEYQKRVHEEIDAFFCDERDVVMDDLSNLKYLEMCFKESLRHCPPIPLMSRKMLYDFKLYNGMTIPKGADAVVLIYDVHHDPEVYPNPHIYDPERFKPGADATRVEGQYIPFSVGLRHCIGQKFALMEARVVLLHILRRFEVYCPQKESDIKFRYGITMEPEPEVHLMLKPRVFNH